MNTYIRIHSSSTCTIFLVAFVAVVVLWLNLFDMDANENKRRRTDIPSWIDDASSLEKIQFYTEQMAHSDDEDFHAERAKAFHDIGDWTNAISDLEYIEGKRKLPADLEVLSIKVRLLLNIKWARDSLRRILKEEKECDEAANLLKLIGEKRSIEFLSDDSTKEVPTKRRKN